MVAIVELPTRLGKALASPAAPEVPVAIPGIARRVGAAVFQKGLSQKPSGNIGQSIGRNLALGQMFPLLRR